MGFVQHQYISATAEVKTNHRRAYINYVTREASFTAKNVTLQEVTTTHQGSADEVLVYFNIPSNYTVYDIGAKFIMLKTLGNEKM
jgi:hypothetical protein